MYIIVILIQCSHRRLAKFVYIIIFLCFQWKLSVNNQGWLHTWCLQISPQFQNYSLFFRDFGMKVRTWNVKSSNTSFFICIEYQFGHKSFRGHCSWRNIFSVLQLLFLFATISTHSSFDTSISIFLNKIHWFKRIFCPCVLVLMDMLTQWMVSQEMLLHLVFNYLNIAATNLSPNYVICLLAEICANMKFTHAFTYYCSSL